MVVISEISSKLLLQKMMADWRALKDFLFNRMFQSMLHLGSIFISTKFNVIHCIPPCGYLYFYKWIRCYFLWVAMFLCYCLFAIGDTSKSLLCKKMLVEEVVVLVCRSCASHRQVDPRKKVDPWLIEMIVMAHFFACRGSPPFPGKGGLPVRNARIDRVLC